MKNYVMSAGGNPVEDRQVPRVWWQVQEIPAGVKALDKDGHPVVGGRGFLNAKLVEFENEQYAPFTEVIG
ncbi:hypothetical protein GS451_23990 [Rhodococcus hoagii]|nr:hypothetical protein [Prescottella equi]MBM4640671.1 hypothetical protein [Prescottella equi]NKV87461.1 hypothetical protein [Prescottella equi]NKV87972.1 hypothetical protein [Prescottella equi]